MNKKEYLKELDYMKGVAILAVIAIHTSVYSLISIRQPDFSGYYAIFFNQLARFCVPVFLMLSALLFFRKYEPDSFSYSSFLSKRVKDLLIPYAVWTLISIYLLPLKEPVTSRGIIETIFLGIGFFYPLYYIPLLFQLMLIILPLAMLFYKKPSAFKTFTAVTIILNLILLGIYEFIFLNNIQMGPAASYAFYRYTQPTLFVWAGYFALGCLIGKYYDVFKQKVQQMHLALITVLFLASTVYLLWDYSLSLNMFKNFLNPGENFFRPSVFIFSMASILLLFRIALMNNNNKLMIILGRYSFGMYLVHISILEILIRKISFKMFDGWIMTTASFLICTSVSALLVLIFSKIPGGWIFTGPVKRIAPKEKQASSGSLNF